MKIIALITLILSVVYGFKQAYKGADPFKTDYWMMMSSIILSLLVLHN